MKKKVDTSSPEHKRQLAIILSLMFVLTALGGAILSYKINEAETKNAKFLKESGRASENPISPNYREHHKK